MLLAGLARDGGLYMPALWPSLSPQSIADFAGQPFADVAARLLQPFVGASLARTDLIGIARRGLRPLFPPGRHAAAPD